MAIMLVVLEVANALSQSGLGSALVQREEICPLVCDTALWASLGVSIIIYLVVYFTAPLIGTAYQMTLLPMYLRVLAIAVPLNAVNSVQRSMLQREMEFKLIFYANMAASIISGVIGVGLAFAGAGIWALIAQAITSALVACITMLAILPWKPSFQFDKLVAIELVSYGWNICTTAILNVIYTGVSELILGVTCSTADLGMYSQGRKWPNVGMSIATNAIQNVMFPAFSRLQNNREELKKTIRRAVGTGTWVLAGAGMLLFSCAEPLVLILLGDRWLGCVAVFRLTCMTCCFLMIQLVNLRAYMALGDSSLYFKLQVVKVVFSCIVIWPIAYVTADINATALSVLICGAICVFVVDLHPARRVHGVGAVEQIAIAMPAIIIALVSSGAASLLSLIHIPIGILLFVQAATFICGYLLLSRIFHVSGASDINRLIKRLSRSIRRC